MALQIIEGTPIAADYILDLLRAKLQPVNTAKIIFQKEFPGCLCFFTEEAMTRVTAD